MDLRTMGMKGVELVGEFVTSSNVFETESGKLYPEGTVFRVKGKEGFKFILAKWSGPKKGQRPTAGVWVQDIVRGVRPGAFELCADEPLKVVFQRLGRSQVGLAFFHHGERIEPNSHHILDDGRVTLTFNTMVIEQAEPGESWPLAAENPLREEALVYDRPEKSPRERKRPQQGRPPKKKADPAVKRTRRRS